MFVALKLILQILLNLGTVITIVKEIFDLLSSLPKAEHAAALGSVITAAKEASGVVANPSDLPLTPFGRQP